MDGAPAIARKRVTLKEMLRWAYNRQQVDSLTGKMIDGDQVAFLPGFDGGVAPGTAFNALGTRVDCAGSNRFARNEVHPDAEKLHDLVLGLGAIDARLVIQFGHTGAHPETQESIPRPLPVLMRGDRIGQGVWRGEATRYRIDVAEVMIERRPVYIDHGRKGVKLSHYETTRTEVEFCPIEWWPDPAWVAAVNGVAEYWQRVTAKLKAAIGGVEFADHEVVDA